MKILFRVYYYVFLEYIGNYILVLDYWKKSEGGVVGWMSLG